jgi:hypothetical protein
VHRRGRLSAALRVRALLALALTCVLAACTLPGSKTAQEQPAPVPTAQRQALAHVDRLRTIRAAKSPGEAQTFNRYLDEAWKFFLASPKDALPVLRRELAVEMARKPRNDFMLLDLGYFLHEHGEAQDRAPARDALLAVDPAADVIRFNEQELFEFAHAAASDGDARVLPFLDRAFLRAKRTIRMPQYGLTLDETGACVLLYGAYGIGAEAHLRRQLNEAAVRRRVLEVLIWIGSPDSNADVRSVMLAAAHDYETFVRAATFLAKAGGPQGRFLLLGLNARALDARTQAYYNGIRKSLEHTTFAELAKPFETAENLRLPDAEVRRRLAAMNSGYGSGERVPPEALLHSGLPRAFLIEQLTRARERLLRRIAANTLTDVQLTDALLNALYYRET